MWLNLSVIILCVNALVGFLGYGFYNAKMFKCNNRFPKYEVMPLWKNLIIISLITLLSAIVGFWGFVIELKSGSYKYGLRYLE